jgi:hypothetical protein
MIFGLTALGILHTVLALVALGAAVVALGRRHEILWSDGAGRLYLAATILTALTALGIQRHGGPGPGHVLAVLTLVAIALGSLAAVFRGAARSVRAVCFSATLLFHLVPGITETLTRLPPGAPVVASPDSPVLRTIYALLLAATVIGIFLQLRRIRRSMATAAA